EIAAIFNAGSAGKCNASLQISPTTANVAAGGTINFTASGGTAPYTFTLFTNNSGGSINPTTGVYSAGTIGGTTDTIRLTDASGATADAIVTVTVFGAPTRLAFIAQPTNTNSNAAITPAVQVAIRDANGNTVTTATNAITIAISNNPSSGTLSGTLTQNAVNGIAAFNNLSINNAGDGYTLTAASGSLMGATSNPFNIINPFCTPQPPNGISWYKAENNGSDSLGTNNGTMQNGADFAPGIIGNGFRFDADNEQLLVPASPSLNVGAGGSLTLEAWVNPTSPNPGSGYGPIFEWGNGSGVQLGRFNNGQLFANVVDTGPNSHFIFTPDNTLTINQFQHVALTYTNATGIGTIYVNGVVVATQNLGGFTPRTNSEMRMGARGGSFNGIIDEAAIYNRALSQTEIQAIFNAGSAGKCDAPLRISPITATVATGGTINFTASGGTAPRTFSILTNNSGGSINPTTGVYTAGATFGVDIVRVTDANNQTADAAVTVTAACIPNQKTWDGGGATNNWSEAANWTCDLVPTSTDTIIFDGTSTKNATVDTNFSVKSLNINAGYTGTITQADATTLAFGAANSSLTNSSQAGGTFVCGSGGAISFNTVIFTQTGGQFNCQNGTIGNSPFFDLRINGGIFNAASGTMTFGGASLLTLGAGGTFNHNNGTIAATGTFFTYQIISSAATLDFNNFTLDLDGNSASGVVAGTDANDKLRVSGTLNLVRGGMGIGTIEARGAVNVSSTFTDGGGGGGQFVFGGGNNQTYTNNNSSASTQNPITVDKTAGTVSVAANLITSSAIGLTITNGTLFLNNNSFLQGRINVGTNGRLVGESSATIRLTGNVVNDGTIDLQGGGANCPQTDSILIRSSSGVQRSWTG
ncbi:MAG: LamG domain-containing protein, partial [Pyrinomonadaceae bacterium]|nr:LamG domain-containing protein [Pyrinomonadaceae bacterium]